MNAILSPRRSFSVLALVFALAGGPAHGQTKVWSGLTGDWHVPGNWSPAGVPTDGSHLKLWIGNDSTPRVVEITTADAVSGFNTFIGHSAGNLGTVNVSNGRTLATSGFYIGRAGNGALNLTGGGKVSNSGSGEIGLIANGTGAVTISGAGSQWMGTSFLVVGRSGHGSLRIESGGIASATDTFVGNNSGGSGAVTVTGAGSLLQNSGSFLSGGSPVTLTVEAGGKVVNINGRLSQGTGMVTGAGSWWENQGKITVGQSTSGPAILTVSAGGKLSSQSAEVGDSASFAHTHQITVNGTSSLWENAGDLIVAQFNKGSLVISDGGQVATGSATAGRYQHSVGTISITGNGSLLNCAGVLVVGHDGSATSSVAPGGGLRSSSVLLASSGLTGGGTLELTGSAGGRGFMETSYISEGAGNLGGSIKFNGGVLRATGHQADFLRNFEPGDVLILEGGMYLDSEAFNVGIGTAIQGNYGMVKRGSGKLTLSGHSTYAGPTTVEEGILEVTGSLTGAVVVKSGALLSGSGTVGGTIFEGGEMKATGDQEDFFSGGVEIAGAGVVIDTQQYQIGISSEIQGSGGLTKQGNGVLVLSGDNTYEGPTVVEAGTLRIAEGASVTSDITVKSGATLGGTGSVAEVIVESGAHVSPGNSPGILGSGNQTWQGGGIYEWEVGALPSTGVPGADWDLIQIGGSLDLAATPDTAIKPGRAAKIVCKP